MLSISIIGALYSKSLTSSLALLQVHGFTCGIADLLLVPDAERDRRHKLRKADKLGDSVHARFAGAKEDETGLNLVAVSS